VLTVLGRGGFAVREALDLHAADLRLADLVDAHLERAILGDAHLQEADLMEAHLEEADLRGAQLDRADLLGIGALGSARLEGALADERTVWPKGFDWRAAGVIGLKEGPPPNEP
jgi:hypothetical protein